MGSLMVDLRALQIGTTTTAGTTAEAAEKENDISKDGRRRKYDDIIHDPEQFQNVFEVKKLKIVSQNSEMLNCEKVQNNDSASLSTGPFSADHNTADQTLRAGAPLKASLFTPIIDGKVLPRVVVPASNRRISRRCMHGFAFFVMVSFDVYANKGLKKFYCSYYLLDCRYDRRSLEKQSEIQYAG